MTEARLSRETAARARVCRWCTGKLNAFETDEHVECWGDVRYELLTQPTEYDELRSREDARWAEETGR
jgi:hypothetical protein